MKYTGKCTMVVINGLEIPVYANSFNDLLNTLRKLGIKSAVSENVFWDPNYNGGMGAEIRVINGRHILIEYKVINNTNTITIKEL